MNIQHAPHTLFLQHDIRHYEDWAAIMKSSPYAKDLHEHVTNPPTSDPNFQMNDDRVKFTMLAYVWRDVVEKMTTIGWDRSKSAKETWIAIHRCFYESFVDDGYGRPDWYKRIVHEIWSQGLTGLVLLDHPPVENSHRVNDIIMREIGEEARERLMRRRWTPEFHAKETYAMLKWCVPAKTGLQPLFPFW